jgi:hypothetical protein
MNSIASFAPMWFCTVPETQIPPGSARASNRAAGDDKPCAIHLRNRLESRPAMRKQFVASSWLVAKSGAFMIRPVGICVRRTSTSHSTFDRYDFAVRVEFENGRPVARVEKASPKLYAANPSR